ncbi:hypothetical protein DY000_02011380 [Brassica cretica]|uniref:DUF4283 domain-containing protein n=1 Tax=Brassica cretica TaxID=69181 RepID=A0ABQ7D332_BRACR|nr:hypothetical protein DY000_02011380 [Brassica cretica]
MEIKYKFGISGRSNGQRFYKKRTVARLHKRKYREDYVLNFSGGEDISPKGEACGYGSGNIHVDGLLISSGTQFKVRKNRGLGFQPLFRRRRAPRSLARTLCLLSSAHSLLCSHVAMLFSKKKHHPPFSRLSKAFRLILSTRMAKKKSSSLVISSIIGAAALGSSISGTIKSSLASFPVGSPLVASGFSFPVNSALVASGSSIPDQSGMAATSGFPRGSGSSSVEISSSVPQSMSTLATEVQRSSGVDGIALFEAKPAETEAPPVKNYAALLKSSAQLQELRTPVEHISGAPFVLIPDENIEAAKLEFKDFIYARFHGDYPSMGKIIGVVNAIWAKTAPRIFVHNIGHGTFLLRVTIPRTREVLLSRTCWNIGGLPMFVAPWSPDYSPDEPPLTSAIVPVEMRNVPYLLFNQESLGLLATAIGKPDSLAPETERKENFEVAKLYVRVDLTTPLPSKIVSGFSNAPERSSRKMGVRKISVETSRRRSQSRSGRSTDKKDDQKGDLEEGDIPQQNLEKTAVSLSPTEEDANVNKNSATEALSIMAQLVTSVEEVELSLIDALSNGISTGVFDVLAKISSDACEDDLLSVSVEETKLEEHRTALTSSVTDLDDSSAVVKVDYAESSPEVAADTTLGTDITVCEGNAEQKPLLDTRSDREDIIHPAEEQDRDNPFFLVDNAH